MVATDSDCLTPSQFKNVDESLTLAKRLAEASLLTSPPTKRTAAEDECLTPDQIQNIRESLALAERLAQASLLTSPSAERRLRARQLEFNSKDESVEFVPPKDVLLYLVRMGSFTSTHTYDNGDHEDSDVSLPALMDGQELLATFAKEAVAGLQFQRGFTRSDCKDKTTRADSIRVMQWNMLSQTIGQHYDKFAVVPKRALDWKHRRYHILQEIITYMPHIICLQEVDHFEFLQKALSTQGYQGIFFPKPDSPCLYVKENNGPDGCAIFYLRTRFEELRSQTYILPVWTINSNQVAISVLLRDLTTGTELCVATTHLKARSGALLASIRKEQGKALLDFVHSTSGDSPVIICGDLNAEPNEPVYDLFCQNALNLSSAYASTSEGREPDYTSWKIREDGEQCQTLDYIFYSKDHIEVDGTLAFPSSSEIGEHKLPSLIYPSDHLSLVCDLSYK